MSATRCQVVLASRLAWGVDLPQPLRRLQIRLAQLQQLLADQIVLGRVGEADALLGAGNEAFGVVQHRSP